MTAAKEKTGASSSASKSPKTSTSKTSTSSAASAKPKEPAKPKEYYCPGCGARALVPGECIGGEFGHAPIKLVDAAELDGPADKHTPAPPTGS